MTASPAGDEVRLRVTAEGEVFAFWVATPGQLLESADELRGRLADQLRDWIAETRRRTWADAAQEPDDPSV